jgi:FMN reductase (NADPH)
LNAILQALFDRKSTRAFVDMPISQSEKDLIIDAAIQAPTAKNKVSYTILEIEDQEIKDALAVSCDKQAFIRNAPLVLVFLADCRRWFDCFHYSGIEPRKPGVGDLMLACVDAVIAAQNAVMAAESLGIGSCYIGDIFENCREHSDLLRLDKYLLPIAMLVMGYPTQQQKERIKPRRFDRKYIVQKNGYSRLSENELRSMFHERNPDDSFDFEGYLHGFYETKYMDPCTIELTTSLEQYLKNFGK